jgi:hypothetical protein
MEKSDRLARICRGGALVLFAIFIGACATIQTGSHHDETTNFAAYQSFSWIDEDPYISGEAAVLVSPLAQQQIKDAIRNQLEQMGYLYTQDLGNADFAVSYTVGTREKISIDSYPVEYRGRWGWHVPYSYYSYRDVSAHSYTKGTLGVDIFDNESGKPVWHGWAEKTVTQSDRQDPTESIEEGVKLLFASFPNR